MAETHEQPTSQPEHLHVGWSINSDEPVLLDHLRRDHCITMEARPLPVVAAYHVKLHSGLDALGPR